MPAPSSDAVGRDTALRGTRSPIPAREGVAIPAGADDRIPRIFLGAGDLAVLALTFVAAAEYAPIIQRLLLPGGPFYGLLPAVFPIPTAPTTEFPPLSELIWLLVATAPATLVALDLGGAYRRLIEQSLARLITSAVLAQIVAISFGALIGIALRLSSASRIVIFAFGLLSAAGLIGYRAALWGYQQRGRARGVYAKNVLLIGSARAVEWMIQHFRANVRPSEFRLAGWLAVRGDSIHTPERRRSDAERDIPLTCLGNVENLGDLLVHNPIHEVVAIQSLGDREWLSRVAESCDYFRVRLRLVPEALLVGRLRDLSLTFRHDQMRLPEVVLSPPYLDADSLFVKRLIDIAISVLLLVILSPLLLLIALAIKLTTPRLSVLYPWNVIGLNGRPFTGYKFTTMVADADERKESLQARNEMQGPVFKVKDDPRVTALGRFLRKYSLNELPQLWSVLKGDMSLVGPRPAFRHELDRYELWHKRKLSVKPGMTCLWQVSGRNRISNFDEWVRLDLEYIEQWNLWLDVRILARTAWAVVSGSGS